MSPFLSIILTVIIFAGGIGFYFFWTAAWKKRLIGQLETKLFSIRVPQEVQEGRDPKKEINISEQLFNSVNAFNVPIAFEIAVPHVGKEICFYASIPGRFAEAFKKQIHSLWTNSIIEDVGDYNIFNYAGVSVGAKISQKERFVLPIRTYDEANSDTFTPILGGLAKINEVGEGGAVQFVVKPAGKKFKKESQSAIKVLKKGWKVGDVLKAGSGVSFSDFSEALHGTKKDDKNPVKVDEEMVKVMDSKAAKQFFEVNVRVVASAPSQFQADSILDGISAGFSQFSIPNRNEFKITKVRAGDRDFFHDYSFRAFDSKGAMILNSGELASIFHLPTPFTEIPNVRYVKSREAPPPANLPKEGVLVGQSFFRGEKIDVRISDDDRRRHIYVIGQTGTGKSNLMVNMASEDIRRGKGVAVIDPHGDLVEDILGLVPKNRLEDVIVFDPGDISDPVGLNMLEYDFMRPEEKTFIVNELLNIFDKLYDLKATGGPMFEQYMRNALLLLMEDSVNEPATLMEVPRVFSDAAFRSRKLARIKNPVVIDFWEKEAVKAGGEAALSNITPYVTSKFNNFTANDYVRPIIGQIKSAFNFREVMDSGKILLVNLSKGRVGDANASLLGMITVGKILMAALGRVDIEQDKRKDFYLYIDEFQNFATESIAVILSEARKYRLDLTLAHQFIAQLPEKIRDSVFGNVGSLVSFRIGTKDAEFLIKQFEPVFTEKDLINIDNYQAYVKLLIGGETAKPFNVRMIRAGMSDRSVAESLKNFSRQKYGRKREAVEQEIYNRLRN
ncbi:DUF87 domain-containing protein [bacterium]|nr:MAG: DUF87 domain-containing protein [bacterium]